MTSMSDEKWRPFIFFSVQGTGDSPTGPDPENRVGDQDIRSPGRPGQFLLCCKYPVNRGIVVPEQDPLVDLPAAFILQNVLQFHQQRLVILRVNSVTLWKIINEDDTVLIPKNRGENFSSGFLHSKLLGRGKSLFRKSIDYCFACGS